MENIALFALVLMAGGLPDASALECYTCSHVSGAPDPECVSGEFANSTVPATCATATQCFTTRTVNDGSNEIVSVHRGCDEADDKMEGCVNNNITYETTCSELCDLDSCNTLNQTTEPKPYVMCYSCQETYNPHINQTCWLKPEEQVAIKCYAPRTCAVKGQWSPDEGVMRSLNRGCEDYSMQRKHCVSPPGRFKDCLYVCCSDYCNDSDGHTAGTDASCLDPVEPAPTRPIPDNASALECYTCSHVSGAPDPECVSGEFANSTVPATCATATQCFTTRTVNDGSNEIVSVHRGCDEADDKMEGCVNNNITYETTCSELCDLDSCNTLNQTTEPKPYVMCYSCQETYNPHINQTCWLKPEEQVAIKCYAPRTCAVKGQWSPDEGVMRSLNRGCEDYSMQRKHCVSPPGRFKDCLYVCCSDYCNDSDGHTAGTDASCLDPVEPAPTRPIPDRATNVHGVGAAMVLVVAAFSWKLLV